MRKDINFNLKKKNGVLIITGGGDGNPEPAIRRANIIFRHINTELVGTIVSLKTNEIPAKEDEMALAEAGKLALTLNELHKP